MAKGGTYSFSRERRLRKRVDFLRIQSHGKRITTPHFVLLVAVRPMDAGAAGRPAARLGIVVTRKLGNAVARNRVKRLCRECFRLLPDLMLPGMDLVVIGRQGADELGLAAVVAEWSHAAPRLRRCSQEALAQAGARTHVSGTPNR